MRPISYRQVRAAGAMLGLLTAVAWFAAYPLDPAPDWPDVILEGSYVAGILAVYYYAARMELPVLEAGLLLFGNSLLLEFLDEFTVDPRQVSAFIAGPMGIVGLAVVFVGARQGARRREREQQEREALQQKLVHAATHDPLTGVANRATFLEQLARLRARAAHPGDSSFALLFIDVDNFKHINDEQGHVVGDALLAAFGRALGHWLRPGDLVGRYGGDEFTVLVSGVATAAEATIVADRILGGLRTPLPLDSRELRVSASIGITICAGDQRNADGLIRDADAAMYVAKLAGGNRWVVRGPSA